MSRREVEAVVDGVVRQFAEPYPPDAVAIHASPTWDGPEELTVGGVTFGVVPCVSVLAARAALADAAGPIILLTPHDKNALGTDLCARIADGRPRNTDRRDAVLRAFGASRLDSRLGRERWLVDELLAEIPPGGYPKVAGGLLTMEHALRTLAEMHLGLRDLAPPPAAFLAWASEPETRARILNAPPRVIERVFGDLLPNTVPFAQEALAAIQGERKSDLVALGLVAGVVSAADGERAAAGRARMEGVIGTRRLEKVPGVAWGDAASAVLKARIDSEAEIDATLVAAEALLEEVDAVELATDNDYLRASFRERLDRYGLALAEALRDGAEVQRLFSGVEAVRDHRLAAVESTRAERVAMSARLAQWLAADIEPPADLSQAAAQYRDDAAWVDYARRMLSEPEAEPNLDFAYRELLRVVAARRASQNETFAHLLSAWDQGASPSLLVVEDVLDQVVAPLAAEQPVLLLVLDGMGWDVWHQLASDVARRGWSRVADAERSADRPCLAAFPTVTEHSRTSLLAGRLSAGGDQGDERRSFPAHAGLLNASKPGKPPVIFHKGELSRSDGGGLADGLADLIADAEQQVVTCVVNAIDDHLLKGDQVKPAWGVDVISPLGLLLDRAQYAQRAIVVTADHGHVLDIDTEARVTSGAKERWRPDDGVLAEDEVRVSGPRTLAGGGTVVMPFAEQLRYSSGRRNGYHGGATPQEVLVPVDVLVSGQAPNGWRTADHRKPVWWSLGVTRAEAVPAPVVAAASTTAPVEPDGQPTLFPATAPVTASWLELLVESDLAAKQRALAGHRAPDPERIVAVLTALTGNGDRLTHSELGEAIGWPAVRVRGLVSSIGRIMNIDGYPVLVNEGDLVVFDPELARQQFGIS